MPRLIQAQTAPQPGEEELQNATRFLFSGDLDRAEKMFGAALSRNPALHRAHYGLGLVYLQKKMTDKAEKSLQEAVRIMPDYAPAYRALGQVGELKNDLSGAIASYQKAVSLESVNPAYANDIAIARFRLSQIGETPEAAENARDHFQKGTQLLKENKKEEALAEFQEVLRSVPKRLDALENASVLLVEGGKPEESAELLRRIVAVDPTILFAHYLLGVTYEAIGKSGEAWDEFEAVLKIGEKTPQQRDVVRAKEKIAQIGSTREMAVAMVARIRSAAELYEKGQIDQSEKEYRDILKDLPDNMRALYGLALIEYQKEQFDEAEKLLNGAIEKDPTLVRAYLFLGNIYLRKKDIPKAIDYWTRLTEFKKRPALAASYQREIEEGERQLAQFGGNSSRALQIQALLNDGDAFYEKEDFDHAAEKYNQVLSLADGNLFALDKLASIYLRESTFNPKKAEEVLKKILSADPDRLGARLQLGFLYEKTGDYDQAIEQYRMIERLDTKGTEMGRRAKKLLVQLGASAENAREIHRLFKSGDDLAAGGKVDEARQEYEKILKIVPDQELALFLVASIDLKLKAYADGEKLLRQIISIDPEHLEAHYQLGIVLGGMGDYEGALREIEKVLSLAKEGKTVQLAREQVEPLKKKVEGESHFKAGMGKLEQLDDLEKKSPPKPGEPLSGERKALLDDGIRELEAAILLNQDNPYYIYNLGFAYIRKNELVGAETMFKRAIEKKPDLLIAHYRLAVLYDLAGATDAATKEYQKVIELGKPEDEEVKEAVGKLPALNARMLSAEEAKGYSLVGQHFFLEQKDKDKALPLLKKAVELDPGNEDYWYNLGVLYDAVPDTEEAEKAYRKAIAIRSNFSKPYFYLGIILEKRGEDQEAYDLFKKAKEYVVDPNSAEAGLIQTRLDFYEKKFAGSFSLAYLNYDSNINYAEVAPFLREISSSYALNLTYYHLKKLALVLSTNFSSSNTIYYYSQTAVNSEVLAFEAKWPLLRGLSIAAGPTVGLNYIYGGLAGWNSQFHVDFQETILGFDAIITHLAYNYSISVTNPFDDSTHEDVTWTFIKNKFASGSLTTVFGIGNTDYVAPDDSAINWSVSTTYNKRLIDYLSGSLSASFGESYFKNPDSTALQSGEIFYRQNKSLSFSATLAYFLFRDLTLSGTVGFQQAWTNTPTSTALVQNQATTAGVTDLLTKQAAPIGSYQKETVGLAVTYVF